MVWIEAGGDGVTVRAAGIFDKVSNAGMSGDVWHGLLPVSKSYGWAMRTFSFDSSLHMDEQEDSWSLA